MNNPGKHVLEVISKTIFLNSSLSIVSMWYKPTILKAMEEFHTRSCIRFIPHTTESNWVEFVKEIGYAFNLNLMA